MTFEKFVKKIVKDFVELEKRVRGLHNTDIVEIIWKRVRNAELSQYITALKVQFQNQPRNYREVLQDITSQVTSIGVGTFQKASKVPVQGTESGGALGQGVYDSNGLIFHGTYPDKKSVQWFGQTSLGRYPQSSQCS